MDRMNHENFLRELFNVKISQSTVLGTCMQYTQLLNNNQDHLCGKLYYDGHSLSIQLKQLQQSLQS